MENLGKLGKDKITGFTGIITGFIYYLTGCNQYGIVPQELKDGKTIDTHWFDASRIEIIGPGVTVSEVADPKHPGGPNDVPYGRKG